MINPSAIINLSGGAAQPPPADTLREMLLRELQHLHSAESQRFTVLPSMAAGAVRPRLRAWFERQCEQTVMQLQRIELAGEFLGCTIEEDNNATMRCLVTEAYGRCELPAGVRDAGLICTAQKMIHYEIAAWTSGRQCALLLGEDKLLSLFQATVDEAWDAVGQLAVWMRVTQEMAGAPVARYGNPGSASALRRLLPVGAIAAQP